MNIETPNAPKFIHSLFPVLSGCRHGITCPTAATKTGSVRPTENLCLGEAVDSLLPTVRCVPSVYGGTAFCGSHSLQEFHENGSQDEIMDRVKHDVI